MRNILLSLVNAKKVVESDCDAVLKEFTEFQNEFSVLNIDLPCRNSRGEIFDLNADRVDEYFYDLLAKEQKFCHLWGVIKILLLHSHGQATVERGISINKNLMVQNLADHSLVAKRAIDDHLKMVGGLTNVLITKELMASASGARQKYVRYLEDQKNISKNEAVSEKRKALLDSIENLKAKQICTERDISALELSSEQYAEEAEKNNDLTLIAKSNAYRRRAREKTVDLHDIENQICSKTLELKK